ncbi:MAG: hypothetical protein JXM69_18195 [Anaerolineae bacterium]|nr:hypothetical protein [Anaerolineae bacterium]
MRQPQQEQSRQLEQQQGDAVGVVPRVSLSAGNAARLNLPGGRGNETRRGLFPAARYRRVGKYITTLPPVVGRSRRFDAWGGVNLMNYPVKFLLSSLQRISIAIF